jgi:hypothetical protein
MRVARAEASVGAMPAAARRCSRVGEFRILLVHILPNIVPIMIVQMSLTMGHAIINAAGLSFIGLGAAADHQWGIMVRSAGFMVSANGDRAVSRPRADDRGILLQPARRQFARHRRPAAEDVEHDPERGNRFPGRSNK